MGVKNDENEVSSSCSSRLCHSSRSSFRLKHVIFAAIILTLTSQTILHLSRIKLTVSNTTYSTSSYLRHEEITGNATNVQDLQNDNSTTRVAKSDACTKEAQKSQHQKHKVVLDHIEILPNDIDALNIKVLCFIPIISTDHNAKAFDVRQTWGKRCDKLLFASNVTDVDIGAIKIDIPIEDWQHLWEKQRETMRYIWQVYGDEYDWFLKADLDTFVIMENLKAYLASKDIQSKKDEPLILGRRVSRREEKWKQGLPRNKTLVDEFLKKSGNKFHYTMGGAGYVMNREYMKTFYSSMDEYFCLSSEEEMTFPEDVGINFCMGNLGVYPHNTRDELGRERFHLRSPEALYNVDGSDKSSWLAKVHRDVGGIKGGLDCCSPASVTFHHVKGPGALYDFERMIYCKEK